MVEPADWLSGDHRPEGVYVATASGLDHRPGEEISLQDFAGMILTAAGVGGRAADESRAERGADVYSDDEQAEVEQRLRELGYLE